MIKNSTRYSARQCIQSIYYPTAPRIWPVCDILLHSNIPVCFHIRAINSPYFIYDMQIPEEQALNGKGDGNASMELGQLDSHEAMSNRETEPKSERNWREKRSYEFLIGLVNNNSKYEVTRVDPSTTVNPEVRFACCLF